MLTRLLFVVAFLQVFSLQNCFAILDENQENMIPPNQVWAPSTPLKSPPEESIFSPLTNLEKKLSPIRNAIAIKKTMRGPLSPESIGRIYEEIAPEFLTTEMYIDPNILDLEESVKRMSLGLNPITYDGQETDVHHLAQTPRRKILIPKKVHQSKDRYIVTKKDLLSGEVTIVGTRLTKERGKEIIKEFEIQALEKGDDDVEFHLIGNVLHPAAGPSRIDRTAFKTERQTILKNLAKQLTSLKPGCR